jgi:sigma-B regulation protein RsbU (phosphoserine phosphatase)
MRLEYVNAGHPAPMLLRADGRLERLEVGGLILGIDSKAQFEEGSIQLAVGDVLLFFTDGVTEAQGEGDELYGDDRIEALLRRERHRTSEEILAALVADVKQFEGPRGPSDDLTAMVLRVVASGFEAPSLPPGNQG